MKTALFSLVFTLALKAQVKPTEPEAINRDQLMEDLIGAPDEDALKRALTAARQAGLPQQMLLEARFLFLVNEEDNAALAGLAPKLEKQLPTFSTDNTLIFAVKEDFESIVHYTKALGALQKKDTALFKKHITEAFWLGPDHGAQFAPHIKALRLEQAMSELKLDLNRTFRKQKPEGMASLATLTGDSPAILVHFWSPWVQPSLMAMPVFKTMAQTLSSHDIPVASFLVGGSDAAKKEADDYLAGEGKDLPGTWLLDTRANPFSSILRISSFPSVVLVNRKGEVLFNGDPSNPALWKQLAGLNPSITPPKMNLVLPGSTPETGPEEDQDPE